MSASNARIAGLYAIADTAQIADDRLLGAVGEAIAGGAKIVQYRDKRHNAETRVAQARELATQCHKSGATFIVNDDPDLAAASGADGVHLGRDDATVANARSRLGQKATIGVSCYNDLARASDAVAAGADYVAFGSFFASRTKPNAVHAEIDLLRRARSNISVPIVAIGGISPENGASLIAAGADALAVIDGLFGQSDIHAAATRYATLFLPRSKRHEHTL